MKATDTVQLFEMIAKASKANSLSEACQTIIFRFLQMFQMDQGAICEAHDKEVRALFAIDATKRIINTDKDLWLSRSLILKAVSDQSTSIHRPTNQPDEQTSSIDEFRIKNVVCIPFTQSPTRVIYLVCRRNPLRNYSENELQEFQYAAEAAGIALAQYFNFNELKQRAECLGKLLKEQPKLIFVGPRMLKLQGEVEKIAPFNVSINIQGESGVGKEEVAKEIHRLSQRKGRFVAVNCANLTESLLESELFGYVKGAFTGAVTNKKGLFEEANGGTLFLDEVAELPFNLQAKLLRVLQERVIRPIGSLQEVEINVRVLAASHKDLKKAIREQKFREDLYYRLLEFSLNIPPLRERLEDLEYLSQHFINSFSSEFNLSRRELSPQALKKLRSHSWPGNIRELKNVCRAAVIISKGQVIEDSDIPLISEVTKMDYGLGNIDGHTLKEKTRNFERIQVQSMLMEEGQTQNSVAKRLDVSVRTIQRILANESSDAELTASEMNTSHSREHPLDI